MKIIRHRRNTLKELLGTPVDFGVEVDIRSWGRELIIHHEPFVLGESFEKWLSAYRHGTLILNVKEEGLEDRLLSLMEKYSIRDFFFLDQSFPFLIKTAKGGEHRCAVRVSEYESIESALSLIGKVDWVWMDCFSRFPLDRASSQRLKCAGFRLCIVSPELQGHAIESIGALRELLSNQGINADAVCTKFPDFWQ